MSEQTLVDRNVHLRSGKFRVLITRRPKSIYGGQFDNIIEAKRVRDALEFQYPAGHAGGVKKIGPHRTMQMLRMERRQAGLCQVCGDEQAKDGCVTCQSCLTFSAAKRRLGRSR